MSGGVIVADGQAQLLQVGSQQQNVENAEHESHGVQAVHAIALGCLRDWRNGGWLPAADDRRTQPSRDDSTAIKAEAPAMPPRTK